MARALGLDISKYDYTYLSPVDFSKATQPIDFVIMRTSYGLKQDEAYSPNLASIQKIPVRGAYHYFSTSVPWQNQADFFLELAAGFHFLAVDYETTYNNLNLSASIGLSNMLDYLLKQSKRKVLLYTNPSIYNQNLTPYTDFSPYDLWLAQYPLAVFLNLNGNPTLPRGRKNWTFWQYGADAFGTAGYKVAYKYGIRGESSVDLNVFNGTPAQLMSYVGNVTGTVINPTPAPIAEDQYVVLADVLNIRDSDNEGTVIGVLYRGNLVHGTVVTVPNGSIWLKLSTGGYACIQGASGTKYMQDTGVNIGGAGY